MQQPSYGSFFVSSGGGVVRYVCDGEVCFEVAVPPGKVPVREYLDMTPDLAELEYADTLHVWTPPNRVGIQAYGAGSHDSGANPDYQPSSASRFEREMRVMLARLQGETSTLKARQRALEAVEQVPQAAAPAAAPQADADAVVE